MRTRNSGDGDDGGGGVVADPKRRVIFLYGMVDTRFALAFTLALRDLARGSTKPILVMLNCPGGSIDDGLAIFDAIKSCPAPVDICATGQASSMGFVILQAGRRRLATPHATFLMHDGSMHLESGTTETIALALHMREIHERMHDIIADRCGKTREEVSLMELRTTALLPEAALVHCFIDGVVMNGRPQSGPQKPMKKRKKR